jgi:bifunctional UDP-N-acetylglucosamine pyrophosphorylase / glucosamine-1-phosphate N-acetyltransferase
MNLSKTIETLLKKGVVIPQPYAVDIGNDVAIEHISGDGVILYPGTKIYGPDTVISAEVKLGYEGPVTIDDCQLGSGCELKAGFFRSSVFLEGSSMESGAHVREGCLLEEETRAGHTVGLKQTILFPFVTLGSLINFCDCLMAGGTDRKNHSEVGSGYVHFNFTPQQDKATASLIGDVPQGVMLRERPIFLGGQGGLVGPARIGFGTVIAAGVVHRGDCPEGGKLITSGEKMGRKGAFYPGLYGNVNRRIRNNLIYLANLLALKQWYTHVRRPFFLGNALGEAVYRGAQNTLTLAFRERLKRLEELAEKMDNSLAQASRHLKGQEKKQALQEQQTFLERWPDIRNIFSLQLEESLGADDRRLFLHELEQTATREGKYLPTIRALTPEATADGERWLRKIVDGITDRGMSILAEETDKT